MIMNVSELLEIVRRRFFIEFDHKENAPEIADAREAVALLKEAVQYSCAKLFEGENRPDKIENYSLRLAVTEFASDSEQEFLLSQKQLHQFKSWLYQNDDKKEKFINEVENFLSMRLTREPVAPAWHHLPLPDDPDQHTESFNRLLQTHDGGVLIGARVRGKKHKHEGTNCDDWFEVAQAGQWSITAVADGAGAKKFSRVGAQVSCQAAIRYLAEQLGVHELQHRDEWTAETFQLDSGTNIFTESDLGYVERKLHEAIRIAYEAVEQAVLERSEGERVEEYRNILGRDLQVNDLSATLLLVVHTVIPYKDNSYSLVMACQIGDGMTCAIDRTGQLRLLGVPDSGEFSGETDFLTSKKFVNEVYLPNRTYPFFGPLQLLMVMTDGVADDYFPPDPELLRLYEDLKSNGVLPGEQDATEEAGETNAASAADVKLLNWLDSYYVRGSFDDRTLVALIPGEGN